MAIHQKLRPFAFHGVDFNRTTERDKEARGTCPFCNAEGRKLYVDIEKQLWDCKHCGRKGNLSSFLQQTLDAAAETTTTADYRRLAVDRFGIPWKMFKDHGFAQDHLFSDPRWLIPIKSRRGGLINLAVYQEEHDVMRTAGLGLQLWRADQMSGRGPVYLCEGEWDALALERLRLSCRQNGSVLGVPGSQMMKDEWHTLLTKRDIIFLYDNDNPGTEGMRRSADKLKTVANSIQGIRWNSTFPEKWDIRDHVHSCLDEAKQKPARVWSDLMAMVDPLSGGTKTVIDVKALDLPRRNKFSQVLGDFKKSYHIDKQMADGLALMFATVLSIQLPGDPIWMFIVGPPGCGKTLLLNAFRVSPWSIFRSTMTPRSLVSGYVRPDDDGGDPSLIPQLTGLCLILKDYTEIMSMGGEMKEEMYGILRGAYDGHVQKTFGNGVYRDFPDCFFSLLAGVTDAIHGDDRASLGERFLKFQLVHGHGYNSDAHIRSAISGIKVQRTAEKYLQRVVAAYSNKDIAKCKIPSPNKWLVDRVVALSQIVALLRTSPTLGDHGDDLLFRPVPEVGTRLAKQLVKLGMSLSVVLDRPGIDEECYRLMARVALDTAAGWNADIFRQLAKHYPKPLLKGPLAQRLRLPQATLTRRIDFMKTIGIISTKPQKTDKKGAGRPSLGWTLEPNVHKLWTQTKIDEKKI